MSGAIKRRLLSLERSAKIDQKGMMERAEQVALQAISDDDLEHLRTFYEGGARLGECTPAERVALERYGAECEAALRLASR